MNQVPVRNGRPCIFRVVRVSGTMRKIEEEAVRRAKLLILAAKDEMASKNGSSSSPADALGALLRSDLLASRTLAVRSGQDDSEPVSGYEDEDMSDDG